MVEAQKSLGKRSKRFSARKVFRRGEKGAEETLEAVFAKAELQMFFGFQEM